VKTHLYGSLFNRNFIYGFFRPKNDLCATCEKLKYQLINNVSMKNIPILKKKSMRMERVEDKNINMIKKM